MLPKFFIVNLFLFTLFLVSCDNAKVYEDVKTMENNNWSANDTADFDFLIEDTLKPCNILFSLKNTNDYPFNNIWFFVKIVFPDKTEFIDTIDYVLQNPRGKWFGISLGGVFGRYLPYRINLPFPITGVYNINICHAMRTDILPGIRTVGLRIENSGKYKKTEKSD